MAVVKDMSQKPMSDSQESNMSETTLTMMDGSQASDNGTTGGGSQQKQSLTTEPLVVDGLLHSLRMVLDRARTRAARRRRRRPRD